MARGLVAKIASAIAVLGSSACAPYVYVRIDEPNPRPPRIATVAPQHIIVPAQAPHPQYPYQPYYENCIDFAASAADSTRPDGNRVMMCTCYTNFDPVTGAPDPHSGYRCEIIPHRGQK
jgi:hypothetical protein